MTGTSKILIVEDSLVDLEIIEKGLMPYNSQFKVLTATNGEEAVTILSENSISTLVTDLYMPKMDGIELLSHMSREHPKVPCVVASSFVSREVLEVLDDKLYSFIEKPVEINKLVQVILDAIFHYEEGLSLRGMTIGAILQRIEMEKKSCLLEVIVSKNEKGLFYIVEGIIYEAECDRLTAEKAAITMLAWDNVSIQLKKLPSASIAKRIGFNLRTLVGQAERKKNSGNSSL